MAVFGEAAYMSVAIPAGTGMVIMAGDVGSVKSWEIWTLNVQSNSREVTPSLRPIANAGRVL